LLTEQLRDNAVVSAWLRSTRQTALLSAGLGAGVSLLFGVPAFIGFLGGVLLILFSVGLTTAYFVGRVPGRSSGTRIALVLLFIKLPVLIGIAMLLVRVNASPLAAGLGVLVGPLATVVGALRAERAAATR